MHEHSRSLFIASSLLAPLLASVAPAAATVTEYERTATAWKNAAPCYEAFAFDQFVAGMAGDTGCLLADPLAPVVLTLGGGVVTVSAFQSGVPSCTIHDGSTTPQASDALLNSSSGMVVFEFNPPVTAFYTYYGSLALGKTCTMKLYDGRSLVATLVSAPSPNASQATGHGFVSDTAIDRIEITQNDSGATLVGAFAGLFAGEPSLGTRTIEDYVGPGGSSTIQLDVACQFDAGEDRVTNITKNTTHPCIRDAINFATNGDVIALVPSKYSEAIDFKGKAITITSADPNDDEIVDMTMIDAGSFQTSAVRFATAEGVNSVLRGISVTGGVAASGGGVFVGSGTSPTVDRCRLIANVATKGGGMYVSPGSTPSVLACSFTNNGTTVNANGGGLYIDAANLTLTNCTFTGNGAGFGGGVYALNASPTFINCEFSLNNATTRGAGIFANSCTTVVHSCTFDRNGASNQGGAIAAYLSGTLSLWDCILTECTAGGDGGAIWTESVRGVIEHTEFHRNASSRGAALFLSGPTTLPSEVLNCWFFGQTARAAGAGGGGSGVIYLKSTDSSLAHADIYQCELTGNNSVGIVADGGSAQMNVTNCTLSRNTRAGVSSNESALVQLMNCILWDASAPETVQTLEGKILWHHCNIQGSGGAGGQGNNIDAVPGFIDDDGADDVVGTIDDNLRLVTGSPCIDAGLGEFNPLNPEVDLDGTPRQQATIDLGAFEYAWDCDANGVADYIQIANAAMADCNQNLRADECESIFDCNGNGIMDECDIAANPAIDGNGNGYIDTCEVSGTISGTQVWNTVNHPMVIATQTINVTGTLTIEDGVHVLVADGVTFNVAANGHLNVSGATEDPVVFRSTQLNPVGGTWNGIRFLPNSFGDIDAMDLSHALTYGVRIESSNVSIDDSSIHDVAGIDQGPGTATSPALPGGPAYGIFVSNANPTVRGNDLAFIRGGHGGRGAVGVAGLGGAWGPDADQPGEDGGNGLDATTPGGPGANGAAGGDAVGIYISTASTPLVVDNRVRSVSGGDGGNGGAGGIGGWGGRGGMGMPGNVLPPFLFYPFYSFAGEAIGVGDPPPTYAFNKDGGDGGSGGTASAGGLGGNGADGGNGYGIRLLNVTGVTAAQNLIDDVGGGGGGAGGVGGKGGLGGDAGWGALGVVFKIPGTQVSIVGHPGVGGDGGDGANGANGGGGGSGGASVGFLIDAPTFTLVNLAQFTIAEQWNGSAGAGGGESLAGAGGDKGLGGIGVIPVVVDELCPDGITICEWISEVEIGVGAGTDGTPGLPGSAGPFGSSGTIVSMSAQGSAQVTLKNSILSSTSFIASTGVTASTNASLVVDYTLLHGFIVPFGPGTSGGGLGIVLADPMFVDASEGDLHLSAASPAIDVGLNSAVPVGMTEDIEGLERIADGDGNAVATVDLGAHEYAFKSRPCLGDLDGNNNVDAADLAVLLGGWGIDGPADLNGDGVVNASDLAMLLGAWGSCP